MLQRLLLHPKTTAAAMVTGLWALGTGAVTTIGALKPLEFFSELVVLRPAIVGVDVVLGVVAMLCLVLCAIGRSILAFVDDDTPPRPRVNGWPETYQGPAPPAAPNLSRTPAGDRAGRQPAPIGDPMSTGTPTPQTSFGANLVGGFMIGVASALTANKATILGDLGSFTPKVDAGIVTVEEDIENKLNPALRAMVSSGFALLNPYIEGEIPTAEEDGFDWLVNKLATEGKKLQGG